jgi:hypothetical protein
MLHFDTTTVVHRPRLNAARQVLGYTGGSTNHNYYIYGYIGNLLYCFEFAPERTRENIILAAPLHGRLRIRVENILPGQATPPDGVNFWVALQREDALNGEGGDVIRMMRGPQPRATGPSEA